MWIGVLGPTLARSDQGVDIVLKQPKHRALLAALATSPGRPLPDDVLIEALWGDQPPTSAVVSLNTYISLTKRSLEPNLPARAASRWLVRSDLGYALQLDPADLDLTTFARAVQEVHARLGTLANDPSPTAADLSAARSMLARLDDALTLWRGTPFADVASDVLVAAERTRLSELRALALEDRATLLVAMGAEGEAVGELEALVAAFPLRERLWALLATAQARLGRQADALASLARLRNLLDEELGLEPSAAVRDLQLAILRQELSTAPAQNQHAPARARVRPYVPPAAAPWPMAGRAAEMAALQSALVRADQGELTFVRVVGEAGIGKSRLVEEFVRDAQDRGALVLGGRCSPEQDAPPLWPWVAALGHDLDLVVPGEDHDASRFAVAQRVLAELGSMTEDQTVVLVLEDLHWADAYSLRVLRHVVDHGATGRLLLLLTSRPTGTSDHLAQLAGDLARRHALTLELRHLSPTEAQAVLDAIAGKMSDPEAARSAWERTDGNPFYLVEYARTARDRTTLLSEVLKLVPRGVADITRQRLRQLPDETVHAVSTSAVIGRDFELDLVAGLLQVDELEALDRLGPALVSELIIDLGADRLRFSHALVREAAYAELSPSRRERLHAQLARTIEQSQHADQRAGQIARHWAAAGDRYVRRAWRAAAHAGRLALAAHAAEEAHGHLESALMLLDRDPERSRRDRLELLVDEAEACRWSSRLTEMSAASDEAVLLAGELGMPDLVVRASALETSSLLWPRRPYGEVNVATTAVVREALAVMAMSDSRTRCLLMLTLADELYYANCVDEVDALVEGAVEMARRLGEADLTLLALQSGCTARWRRSTVAARLAMAEESVAVAREIDDARAVVVGELMATIARCSKGDLEAIDEKLKRVVSAAREQRMYFPELAAVSLRLSLASLRGDTAAVEEYGRRLHDLDDLVSMAHNVDAVPGALLGAAMWSSQPPVGLVTSGGLERSQLPLDAVGVVVLLRAGKTEKARELWGGADVPEGGDDWYTEAHHSVLAEIALGLGDRTLGAQVHEALLPMQGRCLMAGSAPVAGPADAFLALAAAAAGDLALAGRHGDSALAQCGRWDMPVVASWLRGLREHYGF